MRIVHVRSGHAIYGAETVLLGLARSSAARHDVLVAALADARRDGEPALVAAARARGVEALALPVSGRVDPVAVWRIRRLARGADVVHSHDYKSTILATAALVGTGARHVATLHGDTGESRAVRLYERALYAVLPVLHGVAVVSQALEERVRERAARARVVWIANGLDEAALAARVRRGRDEVRAELGVGPGHKLVLAVGRLSPEKNHVALIEAVAGRADVVCAIAGDGPLQAALRARGGARLLGARADVADLYRAADVVAQPSLTEGLPMVVLEALASGTPVVASAVGEIPRVLDVDGDIPCGLVVPPGDAAALGRALDEVLAWPADKLAAVRERAVRRVSEHYGVEAMARRYEEELYGA